MKIMDIARTTGVDDYERRVLAVKLIVRSWPFIFYVQQRSLNSFQLHTTNCSPYTERFSPGPGPGRDSGVPTVTERFSPGPAGRPAGQAQLATRTRTRYSQTPA
eukprot:747773-Hanusia_phi.AAC.4